MMNDAIPSEEQLRGLFSVLEDELPKLTEKMIKTMYNPDDGANIGKAVANFFKELKAAGMGDIPASKITAIYASNLSIKGMMRGKGPMGGPPMGMRHGPMSMMQEGED